MLYKFGRLLQFLGLIIPLVGISGNMARPDDISIKTSLTIAGVGIGIFYLGRFIQEKGAPPA